MKTLKMRTLTTVAAVMATTASFAGEPVSSHGPYAGIGFGRSGFELQDSSGNWVGDRRGEAVKVYGGYQITPYFGAEAGYGRTGQISETRLVNGQPVTETASTRSAYAAATGRFPLGSRFAVTGRIGVAYGDANTHAEGDQAVPGADSIVGHKTSLMGGIGAQFSVSDRVAMAVDVDYMGKQTRRTSTGMITLSVRLGF